MNGRARGAIGLKLTPSLRKFFSISLAVYLRLSFEEALILSENSLAQVEQ
jgi:hypothetical protein